MPLSDTIATISTAMEAAATAQAGGDYRTALTLVETAYLHSLKLPKRTEFENENVEWTPESIRDALDYLKKRVTETGGSAGADPASRSIIRPARVKFTRDPNDTYHS